MTIRCFPDLVQGGDEWLAARRGMLTASEMKLILTPTLKIASNDKERSHLFELLAQRISHYVEPHYIGDDMLRGQADEVEARILYAKHYAPVEDVGFITREFRTSAACFTIGFSPDGLVGDDGFIECKSRRQKFQVETIVSGSMPADFLLQVQTGFFVTGRKWCDFVTYSGGLPMEVIHVYPDERVIEAIIDAAEAFEVRLAEKLAAYTSALTDKARRFLPTERRAETEISL